MLIQLQELTKRHGFDFALEDVSLTIEPGQITTLLGPNGAGKTTLLRCLAGMAVPDSGTMLADGEAFRRDCAEHRRRLHFMPDVPALFPDQSVIHNLGVMLHSYGRATPGKVRELLDLLEEFDLLPLASRRMTTLSRGQEYKAALIGLIAVDPEVWLLDEPFASGMDPHGINAFKRHANAAAARGHSVVYSTQLLDVAERFSTRVCVVHRGRLVADAPLAELRSRAGQQEGVLHEMFEALRENDAAVRN